MGTERERAAGRVLVVEDDPDVADLVRYLLEDEGYRVELAGTQGEGLGKMGRADLTLLAVNLPDGTAPFLCRVVRATPELAGHPIILLGERAHAVDCTLALQAGADDCISKPLDPEELLARVRSLLHAHRTEAELRRQAHRLTVLRQLALILVNTLEVPELAQRVVDAIPGLFGPESAFLGGILAAIDQTAHVLRPYAMTDHPLTRQVARLLGHPLYHFQAGYDPPADLLRKVAYLGQAQEAARLAEFIAPLVPAATAARIQRLIGMRGGVAMPVRAQGKLNGVLLFILAKPVAEITALERDVMSDFVGTIGVALENVRLYAEAARLMVTDGLTGLANRRRFDRALADEIARARRLDYPVGLLLLDVDHFKTYNDHHGHLIGDQVLRAIAQTLIQAIRATDLAARYGGEEFALILPGTPAAGLRVVAEKLRQAVHELALEEVPDLVPPTLSIGGASIGPPDLSADVLLNVADATLYQAKNAGRDRVVIASGAEG